MIITVFNEQFAANFDRIQFTMSAMRCTPMINNTEPYRLRPSKQPHPKHEYFVDHNFCEYSLDCTQFHLHQRAAIALIDNIDREPIKLND